MTPQEIQAEINKKEAELQALPKHHIAAVAAGGAAGLYLAHKNGKGLLGKVGFILAGTVLVNLPMRQYTREKYDKIILEISNLKAMLPR